MTARTQKGQGGESRPNPYRLGSGKGRDFVRGDRFYALNGEGTHTNIYRTPPQTLSANCYEVRTDSGLVIPPRPLWERLRRHLQNGDIVRAGV